jgi:hypothetical protein
LPPRLNAGRALRSDLMCAQGATQAPVPPMAKVSILVSFEKTA